MDKTIKVTNQNCTIFPLSENEEMVVSMINDSNLFDYLGKSKIDYNPIFSIKEGVIRLGKIQKIKGEKNNIIAKYYKLIGEIKNDITFITE